MSSTTFKWSVHHSYRKYGGKEVQQNVLKMKRNRIGSALNI